MDNDDYLLHTVIDGLRLAASTFEVQAAVLPDFVHHVDEVLMAVDWVYIEQLHRNGRLNEAQFIALKAFDDLTGQCPEIDEATHPRDMLKNDEWFELLRAEAKKTLDLIGYEYKKPDLDGTTYVRA